MTVTHRNCGGVPCVHRAARVGKEERRQHLASTSICRNIVMTLFMLVDWFSVVYSCLQLSAFGRVVATFPQSTAYSLLRQRSLTQYHRFKGHICQWSRPRTQPIYKVCFALLPHVNLRLYVVARGNTVQITTDTMTYHAFKRRQRRPRCVDASLACIWLIQHPLRNPLCPHLHAWPPTPQAPQAGRIQSSCSS